jgi:uncharacterized membrane protein YsdA (DUF1294 family)
VIDAVLILLVTAELAAFGLFWFDKVQARDHGRRVPERTLLLAALLGGLGALVGQQLLRHKTRKDPFRTRLGFVLALHIVGAVAFFWMLLQRPIAA